MLHSWTAQRSTRWVYQCGQPNLVRRTDIVEDSRVVVIGIPFPNIRDIVFEQRKMVGKKKKSRMNQTKLLEPLDVFDSPPSTSIGVPDSDGSSANMESIRGHYAERIGVILFCRPCSVVGAANLPMLSTRNDRSLAGVTRRKPANYGVVIESIGRNRRAVSRRTSAMSIINV